jgi:outer membrane protein W
MTRPTSVALAPSSRNPLPARLLPHLVTLLLVCGSVAGAPLAHAQDDAVDEGAQALVAPESEEQPTTYALDGRSRFEMRLGASDVWVNETHRVETVDVTGGAASLVFLHWIDERFALEISLGASNVGVTSRETMAGEITRADGFGSLMAGGRFYLPMNGAFRPHVGVAVGPLTDFEVRDRPLETEVTVRTTRVGLALEGGVDFLVGGHFVIGVHGGAIARDGYSPQGNFGVNLGWAFGGP